MALLSPCYQVHGQAVASTETLAGIGVAGDYATISESVYIGPGDYVVNGSWNIYAKNVWVSPDATISGTGTISFYNPGDAGGAGSATLIDGNNNVAAINAMLAVRNSSGATLTQIVKDGSLAGWQDDATASSIYIGNDLNLAVSGANVTLGPAAGDLILTTGATISGYSDDRFVVTNNSTASHLVKQSFTGPFTFPVGLSSADYTPATIDNATANGFSVSVQDTAQSTAYEEHTGRSIGRVWNVVATNATGNSVVTLQHNIATEEARFNGASHFITQLGATSPNTTGDGLLGITATYWQANAPQIPVISGGTSSVSRVYTDFGVSVADPLSFFTVRSAEPRPLPAGIQYFTGTITDCKAAISWATTQENSIAGFEVQYGNDGTVFQSVDIVKAVNNMTGNKYNFTHAVQAPVNYYRLKIIDRNNDYSYSNVITLKGETCFPGTVRLSPNPTSGICTLTGLTVDDFIEVYNASGQLIVRTKAVSSNEVINLSKYPSATFYSSVLK